MSVVGSLCFRPEFNFTSQYLVRVDDFFLHYLQKVNYLTARNKWSVMNLMQLSNHIMLYMLS